jgi:hypothetical protein
VGAYFDYRIEAAESISLPTSHLSSTNNFSKSDFFNEEQAGYLLLRF